MKYRQLGSSSMQVSVIGYGAWQAGQVDWQVATDQAIAAAVGEAFAQGINFFDTAPIYGNGQSEKKLGSLLAAQRENLFLATKCGLFHSDSGRPRICLKYDSILQECEASLGRLGVDCIDLYQIHWPDRQTSLKETFRALHRLQDEGMVRHLGVCNFRLSDLEQVVTLTDQVVSVQLFYNVITRGLERDILPFCMKNNISIIGYSPLCQGLLAGQVGTGEVLPARAQNRHYINDKIFKRNLELLEKLRDIAANCPLSLAQLALSWIISRSGVGSVMVGSTSAEHIKEDALAAEAVLPPHFLSQIEDCCEGELVQPWISFFY